MANVNVSVTADQTPITVVIALPRTIDPPEGTDISASLEDHNKNK
jgi:hypothetical protein